MPALTAAVALWAGLGGASRAFALGPVDLTLRPHLGGQVGHDVYSLTFEEFIEEYGETYVFGSDLDWPEGAFLLGADLGVAGPGGDERDWEVVATVLATVTDPASTMGDVDWYNLVGLGSGMRQEFSSTQSEVRGGGFTAEVSGRVNMSSDLAPGGRTYWDFRFGYRQEAFSLDAYGLTGWQEWYPGERYTVDLDSSFHGGHYGVTHALPFLGFGMRSLYHRRVRMDGAVDGLLAFTHGVDDHVWRHKVGDGRAWGFGIRAVLETRYEVTDPEASVRVSLGGRLEGLAFDAAWGSLSQQFYGDDPDTPGDETGLVLPSSDFSMSGSHLAITFFADATL
jgi:hypothetical protein